MSAKRWLVIGALAAVLAAGAWVLQTRSAAAVQTGAPHIVLIGASIGQDWELAQWPKRVGVTSYTAEALQVWKFDKSEAVEEVLMRPKRRFALTRTWLRSLLDPPKRPRLVILKECSSYFPSDLEANERAVARWVSELQAGGIDVALATVVPVTHARSDRDPGKQQSLSEFNQWIRSYAAQQNLPLIDLDAALRTGEPGSYMRDEYTSGDGSHLNRTAYGVLDRTLLAALCGGASGDCKQTGVLAAAR